ncbi:MAG TPA: ABC transporter permease [Silvibacterium sp.]|nr:ABC transporter permease [Silvibacterium sp.]
MQALGRDIRYALRQLLKTPAFTIAALLTLALGIGVNAAMFSVIDQVLLRPLPYGNASRLVKFGGVDPADTQGFSAMSLPDLQDIAARSHSLQGVGFFTFQLPTLGGGSAEPKITPQVVASANLFDLIGVRPMLGRGFVTTDDQPGHNNVLVLSYSVWQQSFHSDRSIVGHGVTIDGDPYTVIGVLPPQVAFPGDVGSDAIYSPLVTSDKTLSERGSAGLSAFALLRPGVTLPQVRSELNGIRRQLQHEHPKEESKDTIRVNDYRDSLTEGIRPAINALNFAVIAVWLIACANVAGLMLTRSNGRRREIAIVTALGAPRGRVIQQFLTESLVLALAGGAAGLGLAALALHALRHYLSNAVLYGNDVHINVAVCLYLLIASIVSAVLFGLAPAWTTSHVPVQEGLREGAVTSGISRRQALWRDALVAGEITLTLALLIAAGLMMRTLLVLRNADFGFQSASVVTGDLYLPTHGVWWSVHNPQQGNLVTSFYQPLLQKLEHTPGILSAGFTTVRPLQPDWSFNGHFKIKGQIYTDHNAEPEAVLRATTAGYYNSYGIRLLSGRFFNDQDTPDAPIAVIVNQAFVKRTFPNQNPLGQQIEVGDEKNPVREWGTIVGVADDVRQRSAGEPSQPEININLFQLTPADPLYPIVSSFLMNVAVRTHLPAAEAESAIRTSVHALQPQIGIDKLEPMHQIVDDSMGNQTLSARLLGMFGFAALLIAIAGIYGLLSYSVSQRTREFGVRLALGAPQSNVHWIVLRHALLLLAIGIAAGIALAVVASGVMRAFIYGFRGYDVVTVSAVAVILALCGLAASYLPARRAASIDPMVALRAE